MNPLEPTGRMRTLLTTALATAALALALPRQADAQNVNVTNAFNHLRSGELAQAAEYIEPATQDARTGANEKTWRYRGDIYKQIALGDDPALKQQFPDALDKAIESYLKANELDKKGSYKRENVQALGTLQVASLNGGNDAFTAKDYDRAIAMYGQSERIARAFGQVDTNAVFNSALAYDSKGDAANAIKRYREAIDLGYKKPEIYRYIANLHRKAGDEEAAIAITQEGRAAFPDDKELILDHMTLLLNAGRSDEAEVVVREAQAKDPGNAALYSVEGGLYDKKATDAADAGDEAAMYGWYDKAEAAYTKSIEVDPTLFDAYFNIGVLYNNRAAYEYEKCNKIKSDKDYMVCKGKADEVYLKARPFFDKAHELRADDRQTIQQLMKLYAKIGDQAKYDALKAELDKL